MKFRIILLLNLSLSGHSFGQLVGGSGVFNPTAIVEGAGLSTVTIELGAAVYDSSRKLIGIVDSITLGTGFMVQLSERYIVTNYHVVKNHNSNQQLLLLAGLTTRNRGKVHVEIDLVGHDSTADVAFLRRTDRFFGLDLTDSTFTREKFTGLSWFMDDSLIDPGISVISIGYPLGIGVEIDTNKPVFRMGMVAQGVSKDGWFVIDGFTNHGNSGSPIYSHSVDGQGKFLGMIAGFYNEKVTDSVGNEIWGRHSTSGEIVPIPYNSGLSVCVAASVIKNMLVRLENPVGSDKK